MWVPRCPGALGSPALTESTKDPAPQTTGSIGGERVKVAMRLRPMMPHELARNDQTIVSVPDNTHVHLDMKTGAK